MHWNRILFGTTVLSFGLVSLLLIYLSQEPLCIDSRVVERIDKLSLAPSSQGPETVYRCAVRKSVPYSGYFAQNLPPWADRIKKTERFLESIEPFYRRVQIAIVPKQDSFYQVHNHQIRMGEGMLDLPGHLERALIKVWFRERNQNKFDSGILMEEVVTDFLLFALEGDVKVQDLKQGFVNWKAPLSVGPFILQSQGAYCESPWRRSEHYYACDSITFETAKISASMSDLSLRPLLTQLWIRSYLDLSGSDRYRFVKQFANLVRSARKDLSFQDVSLGKVSAMTEMVRHLKQTQRYVTSASLLESEKSMIKFQRNYMGHLHQFGFYDSSIEAQVDFIYVSQESLAPDSEVLSSLAKYTKKNVEAQVAVRDEKSLWIMPSRFPLAVDSISQIKSKRMAVQICGNYDFSFVFSFAEQTEKLLVINECNKKRSIDYTWYVEEGIESFSSHHPDLAFVQYHIPSLAMKATELKGIKNVFDVIQPRWNPESVLHSLGWQKVLWNETARAYRPQAVIDGIEWFRLNSVRESSL